MSFLGCRESTPLSAYCRPPSYNVSPSHSGGGARGLSRWSEREQEWMERTADEVLVTC